MPLATVACAQEESCGDQQTVRLTSHLRLVGGRIEHMRPKLKCSGHRQRMALVQIDHTR